MRGPEGGSSARAGKCAQPGSHLSSPYFPISVRGVLLNLYLGQAPQEIPMYLCECRCQGEHKEVGEQPEGVHSLSTMWAPGIRLGSGTFICWAIPLAIKDLYLKKQESKVNSNGITSLPTNVQGRASGKHLPLASGNYSTPLLPSSVLLPLKKQKRCKLYVRECLLVCAPYFVQCP